MAVWARIYLHLRLVEQLSLLGHSSLVYRISVRVYRWTLFTCGPVKSKLLDCPLALGFFHWNHIAYSWTAQCVKRHALLFVLNKKYIILQRVGGRLLGLILNHVFLQVLFIRRVWIFFTCSFRLSLCLAIYSRMNSMTLLLLFFEPLSIAFETLQVVWRIFYICVNPLRNAVLFPISLDGFVGFFCRSLWFMVFSFLMYGCITLLEMLQSAGYPNYLIFLLQVVFSCMACSIMLADGLAPFVYDGLFHLYYCSCYVWHWLTVSNSIDFCM